MGYIPNQMTASQSLSGFRKELSLMIKCILVSSNVKLTVDEINEDFVDLVGRPIPYSNLFFDSLEGLFKSMPRLVKVDSSGKVELVAEPGKSAHIRTLVSLLPGRSTRDRFDDPRAPYKRRLSNFTFNDILPMQSPVHKLYQMVAIGILNRNRLGITVSAFENELNAEYPPTVAQRFRSVKRLLEKLAHLVNVFGDIIYPSLDIYDADIQTIDEVIVYRDRKGMKLPPPLPPPRQAITLEEPKTQEGKEKIILFRPIFSEAPKTKEDIEILRRMSSKFSAYKTHEEDIWSEYNKHMDLVEENRRFEYADENGRFEYADEDSDDYYDYSKSETDDEEEVVCKKEEEEWVPSPRLPAIIPTLMRDNLTEILAEYPQGLWTDQLLSIYQLRYRQLIDFFTFGCESFLTMLLDSPLFFHAVSFGGDCRVYSVDLKYPPDPCVATFEREKTLQLLAVFEKGVSLNYFIEMYWLQHRVRFSFEAMGFKSLKEALESLQPHGVRVEKINVVQAEVVRLDMSAHPGEILNVYPFSFSRREIETESHPDDVVLLGSLLPKLDHAALLPLGSTVRIKVLAGNGPASFFVEIDNGLSGIRKETLNEFYQTEGERLRMPRDVCVFGTFCVVKDNDTFHRAFICDDTVIQNIQVFLLDLGVFLYVDTKYAYYLSNMFAEYPGQAFLCYLAHIMPPRKQVDKFSFDCNERFCQLVNDKSLMAEVIKKSEIPEVGLFLTDTTDGQCIDVRSELADKYLAIRSTLHAPHKEKMFAFWSLFNRMK